MANWLAGCEAVQSRLQASHGVHRYSLRPALARSNSMSWRTISARTSGNATFGSHPRTSRARDESPTS